MNFKKLQYAGDTEIMLEGDKNSFEETVKTINTFGKASGLFLNAGKTSAIWLGNKRNSPVKYMPHLQMEWNPPKFKILGIWFTNDLKECEVLSFSDFFLRNTSFVQSMVKETNNSTRQSSSSKIVDSI